MKNQATWAWTIAAALFFLTGVLCAVFGDSTFGALFIVIGAMNAVLAASD